jgi:HrpA-like RNA helicase
MPTLLEKGKIIIQKWMSSAIKQKINNMTGIDFLIEYIGDRLWEGHDVSPKFTLKGIGNKVLVLRSGTGSGKSTLLPPFLHKTYFETNKKNLIITQPTKATATSIPYQIIQYNDFLTMGDNIGFQTGSIAWKPIKGILFATVGILLQHLKIMDDDMFMHKYSFIIIDEVHARSMDVDSALFYIKRLLERNWDKPECPFLILTSATFNPIVFMDYFNCPKEHFLDVEGATFPIKDNFIEFDLSDYITYTVDLIESIHVDNIADIEFNSEFRDVLVFVQGGAQIKEITKRIHKLNTLIFSKGIIEAKIHSIEQMKKYKTGGVERKDIYYIAPITVMSASIQEGGKEYKDLFSKIESVTVDIYEFDEMGEITDKVLKTVPASRRIMIGTNAIETGMTIDTLKYCIDTGFVKQSSFDPSFGCNILVDKSITQANSKQRRGRVGRKAPGIFYSEYTRETHDYMPELPFPDIVKEDVSSFLLGVIISETKTDIVQIDVDDIDKDCFQKNQFDQNWFKLNTENVFEAEKLDFIQYPSSDSIGYGMEKLHGLGFIDNKYNPTLYGLYANKFRKVKLESIRMILAGYKYEANILDLITIACCIEVGFAIGINKRKYVPRNPLSVGDTESYLYYKMLFADEFIEYLFIWDDFMKAIGKIGNQMKNQKKNTTNPVSTKYLENWCKENHFNIGGLYTVIDLRDQMINDMLGMGINPYYNGLKLNRGTYNLVNILNNNLSEGMNEIKKIKLCIYEGYRFNILIWNNSLKSYVNNYSHGLVEVDSKLIKPLTAEFKNDEDIIQIKPQKIIVSNIMVKPSFKNKGMYEFSGGDVSVLDGYVEVDINFLNH